MSDAVVDDFTVESSGEHAIAAPVPVDTPAPVADDASTTLADAASEPEATIDEESEPADGRERDEHGRFKPRHPRDDPKSRISQLTAKYREAEREREELKARIAQLETGAAPPKPMPVADAPRPVLSATFPDFQAWSGQAANQDKSYEDYLEERLEHRLALKQQQAEAQRRAQSFQVAAQQARASRPSFQKALETIGHIPLTPVLQTAIVESEKSIDLIEYLALHPEEFAQLAVESHGAPPDAAIWMRRFLESKVAAAASPSQTVPAPKPVISTAKPPIQTVGSSPVAADPHELSDDLPIEEYIRRANARDRQKRRGL